MSTENTVDELVALLKRREQEIWLDKPADIRRLVGRNYHTGREFPVWFYSLAYLEGLSVTLNTYNALARKHEGDLKTLTGLAALQTRYYSDSGGEDSEGFRRIAHLNDTADLLEQAADRFDHIDDWDDFARLTKALQRYLLQLKFWVDIEFPWKPVSEQVDRYWHERYGDDIE